MFLVLIISFCISGYFTYNWVLFKGRVELLPKMEAIKFALLLESENTLPSSVVVSGGNEEC